MAWYLICLHPQPSYTLPCTPSRWNPIGTLGFLGRFVLILYTVQDREDRDGIRMEKVEEIAERVG